jgi:AmiR/NasT family two-component response regulator
MSTSTTGRKPCVLIFDSHRDSADIYAAYLSCAGFVVENSDDDGTNASGIPPDVILFGVTQCEHTPKVHVIAHGHEVPIIAINSNPRDVERAGDFGYASVLVRPVKLEQLLTETLRVATPQTP